MFAKFNKYDDSRNADNFTVAVDVAIVVTESAYYVVARQLVPVLVFNGTIFNYDSRFSVS